MNAAFSINKVYEESININFTITGNLTTHTEFYILQTPAIKNVKKLNGFTTDIVQSQANGITFEYRTSFNNTTWTSWTFIDDGIITTDFLFENPNNNIDTYLQIRLTYYKTSNSLPDPIVREINIIGERKLDPIFEPYILTPDTPVIFTNQDTYKVYSITGFNTYLSDTNASVELTFRYTQNQGRLWSAWIPLTADNLKTIKFDPIRFCNFQFGFKNNESYDVKLNDLELIGEFNNITAGYKSIAKLGIKTQCNPLLAADADGCCKACSDCDTPWSGIDDTTDCKTCDDDIINLNDKSLWTSQIKLYNELNNYMNKANSWKVTYCLADPDGKGIDTILYEQQLHNIILMKDINIIVPDNQFPTDAPVFNGFDMDLMQTFEVHITKDTFKKAFGVEFRPGKKDILYFCDLNQLWEVNSQFPKRGFMNAETYYRVILIKYNDRKDRKFVDQGANDLIGALTKHTTLDDLFNIDNTQQLNKAAKDKKAIIDNSSQQYTPTTLISVRKSMDTKVIIKPEEIWNASLTVAKSVYQLPIKLTDPQTTKLVEYNLIDNVNKGDNRAISFWFKTEDYNSTYKYSILNNTNFGGIGYYVEIFNNTLKFVFNTTVYNLQIALSNDTWYCILINLNQIQQQVELAIYKRQDENGITLTDSKLLLVNKMIFDNVTPAEFILDANMYIGKCNTFDGTGNRKKWYLTNLRIYNTVVDSKTRSKVLNENVVNDNHLTLLVDNAEEKITLPNYGNI